MTRGCARPVGLIPQVFYQRDPLSPPFHVNLMLGLAFSAGLACWCRCTGGQPSARGRCRSPLRKSRRSNARNAKPARNNGDSIGKRSSNRICRSLCRDDGPDCASTGPGGGQDAQILVVAGDGSFANRTCFAAQVERTELIARTRKDAVLCYRATAGFASFL